MINQKPIKTKVRRMQTFLRSMTPTKRAKFRQYVLNLEKKLTETKTERVQTLLRSMTMTK